MEKQFENPFEEDCRYCDGEGKDPNNSGSPCPVCHGAKKLRSQKAAAGNIEVETD